MDVYTSEDDLELSESETSGETERGRKITRNLTSETEDVLGAQLTPILQAHVHVQKKTAYLFYFIPHPPPLD